MLIKQLKYDLSFSKTAFFAMAAITVGIASILRLTMFAEDGGLTQDAVQIAALLILFGVGIACVMQIFQFFSKNFFGDIGYLMLTLPVRRAKLLISKVIVSVVWFNFMLLAGAVAWYIAALTQLDGGILYIFRSIGARHVIAIVEINMIALFFMSVMFFAITLSHSVISGRRVHGIISGVIALLYTGLYFWLDALLRVRNNVGRIPIGDGSLYFDIFNFGLHVGLCLLALCMTYYLLKKRTSLR
jgi:hypothetical protein